MLLHGMKIVILPVLCTGVSMKGGTDVEGVWEQGAEGNIWT
jgi:hypothetical protein